jgi:hypothetical protein
LSFYGYTERISEEYFNKVFETLKGRLWLPAQVIYEFEKNTVGIKNQNAKFKQKEFTNIA